MRRHVFFKGLLVSLLLLILPSASEGAGKMLVFVSIPPQKYFVEKIVGDLVDVSVMVLPGSSPATYEPKPNQMVAMSKARLYFAVGVPFEKVWLKKFLDINPKLGVVHTEEGIEKIPMKGHHHYKEDGPRHKRGFHQERERDDYGIQDPHIWLSPPLVMLQARNILTSLLELDPVHSHIYEANYKKLVIEIIDLDAEIRGLFSGKRKGARFMVFHPAWGYFADAYGLEQMPIEIEGKEPKPRDLGRLMDYAQDRGIKVIFVQPQFSARSAEIIAKAIKGEVLLADPLAYQWAKNLREQAVKFRSALK